MGGGRATMLPVALVAVLLALLAGLQYRWIGELSQAEERRMRDGLSRSARRFAADLDRELGEVLWALQPRGPASGDDAIPRQVELWRERASHPDLLRDLWSISRGDRGPELERLDEASGAWSPVAAWPPQLEPIRPRRSRRLELPIVAEIPALVVPRMESRGPPGTAQGGRRGGPRIDGLLVAELDLEVIAGELLPELAERHFGDGDYDLAVLDRAGSVLYRSNSERSLDELLESDERVELLRPRSMLDRRSGRGWGRGPREGPRGPRNEPPPPPGDEADGPFGGPQWRFSRDGAWQLVARHSAGSLQQAVARARRRNLVVSGGVVLLLGAAAGLLVGATRRTERLARQQMEFVAGVTHELHTPLAAICSAGSNLADGVVSEAQRVRSYGEMIRAEGQRLTHTVDQVLEFAGIQSGGRVYRMEPLDVSELVAAVLDQNELVIQESGLEVERDLAPALPPVEGDPAALRRAVDNLVANAVRHARSGGWLGVSTALAPGGAAVEIRVADRGPGVPAEERTRLFEPFFRGRASEAAGGKGTGLGLSIVRHVAEAHGGRIRLESGGQGACFVLRLPLRPASESAT